ncbi:MAG TPA: 4Fe-4S binding protein [Clostridiales bacterium]|nr:4Fe-4S binding protein [Clostridiales bacterium]
MNKTVLGNTGIEVTKLCFGALPLGPLQKNLSVEEGAEIIAYALKRGVNFIDTAQMYGTYPHIKAALEKVDFLPVIATKSTAETYESMGKAVNEALEQMGLDHIDIFHLHAARVDTDVFDKREGALRCLLDYKKKGKIKAIGISTHNVKVVDLAAEKEEIDVVFALINKIGRGIINGTAKDMEEAMEHCRKNGKGIYLMKVLGGGTMIDDYDDCMEYAMSLPGDYSIAVGMISKEEVDYNVRYFNGERNLEGIITIKNRKIVKVSQVMCKSCGTCIDACHSDAISFDENEKAYIDPSKCIQCGYCIAACPEFSIRVV